MGEHLDNNPNYPNNPSPADIKLLSGVSVLIQNMNTLNLSTTKGDGGVSIFNEKMEAILSIGADITLMSDIRAKESSFRIIEDYIRCTSKGNFKIIINSDTAKRGVAIMYKASLDIIIENIFKSECNNVVLTNILLNSLPVTLGAIYGPKDCDDEHFFTNLRTKLSTYSNGSFIVGGDMNSITSNNQPSLTYLGQHNSRLKYSDHNIEILNMRSIPNPKHSQQIIDGIADGFWVEPFRILNNNLREYSYVPFSSNKMARSRIDFFLCSHNMLSIINEVKYLPLLSDRFDHKPVFLRMQPKDGIRPPLIDNSLLSTPGIEQIGYCETLHLLAEHLPVDAEHHVAAQDIFRYNSLCDRICELTLFIIERGRDDRLLDNLQTKLIVEALIIKNNIPPLDALLSQTKNISDPLFFECLQNNIKINVVNYQKRLRKAENHQIKVLTRKLDKLKENPNSFCNSIFDIEAQLQSLNDDKIKRQCRSSRTWQALHLEKPSRSFCLLAKSKKKADSLKIIKDTLDPLNHKDFESQYDRSKYIADFYKKIYEKGAANEHNIHQFLGADISQSPYVQNKILSNEEKLTMENEISLQELDLAIKKSNKFSAPGIDGWSYRAADFFWDIFRSPLKKAFNSMVENQTLDFSFKRVVVKLIPKKADLVELKNWRPISLLSVFYKIPSSAFAARLKTVFDKIVSKRQKAYSNRKVIQEAVLNTLDNISKCIRADNQSAIALIDFRKAFDTISHNYIIETLKFFNFGEKMINITKTLQSGRCGSILTEDGHSPTFNFDSGIAQGAPESAYLFCIGLEPLLIKLKLCPSIEKIVVFDQTLMNNETLEGVAFADDASEFMKATLDNLKNFKIIIDDFFRISDLGVNLEKTAIVPLAQGDNGDFLNHVHNEGFIIERKFKLLGYLIDNNLKFLRENIQKIIDKLTNITTFWEKFKLSVPGRVAIFKTYLLSNIGYVCSIIPTDVSDFNLIDTICYKFVTKSINIGKEAAFAPAKDGGLGLIKSRLFCNGLRVGMFKRSLQSDDTWAVALRQAQHGSDPLWLNISATSLTQNPFSALIGKSFAFFYTSYLRQNNNFLYAPIFDNCGVIRNRNGQPLPIDDFRFGAGNINPPDHLADMRFCHLINRRDMSCRTRFEIMRICNIHLDLNQHSILRSLVEHNIPRLIFNDDGSISPRAFLNRIKKGSKKYREILLKDGYSYKACTPLKNRVITINNQLTLQPIRFTDRFGMLRIIPPLELNLVRDSAYASVWNHNFIWNHQKNIFIKFFFSRLIFNLQKHKIDDLIEPTCILCRRNRFQPLKDETIYHLILECGFYKPCITVVIDTVRRIEADFSPHNILVGSNCTAIFERDLINILSLLVINFTYLYRGNNPAPTAQQMRRYINGSLCDYAFASKKFSRALNLFLVKHDIERNCFLHPEFLHP